MFNFNSPYFHPSKLLKKLDKLGHTITFQDILLKPQYSEIESRKNVDLSQTLFTRKINLPIISANMDTVTGTDMGIAMSSLGGFGILHRYQSHEDVLRSIEDLKKKNAMTVPSIGVQDGFLSLALDFKAVGVDAVCLDIAHGDTVMAVRVTKALSDMGLNVIAGNVATYEGALRLAKAGAKMIKVGVGGGSACSTRPVTGHGVPQIVAIADAVRIKNKYKDIKIIADGGITSSGDAVKALAMGADFIMIGGMLAGCLETPGKIVNNQKVYRGMASAEARTDFDPKTKGSYVPEGVAVMKPVKGPAFNVVNQLDGGIRSGFSYTGASNLTEFHKKVKMMFISPASWGESLPHALRGSK